MTVKNEFSLEGKVIVVTGGTGIIGKSFITAISDAGGTVGILGRNRKVAEQRSSEINLNGGRALALCADVTNKNELINARKQMLNMYGKIDGLVNAAGGNIPEAVTEYGDDIFNLNVEGLKKVMDTNLWGTILPTQVFGDAIARNGSGSIVNISSMSAKKVISKILGYSLAKASVECFTQWFALELSRRYKDLIRINAIVPGFFLTEQNKTLLTNTDGSLTDRGHSILKQTPFGRFGDPDELKGTLIWLLSDSSKFITGTTVNVDGGFVVNSGV
ncbi:SDR family oxidoreductase [Parafilimonas terrae]|uniref:NAD(P)-dependent dehydrogenase, short-chain alcohol dehydrogenase family n=1 Tax=Parafilimonas terrae TaxID=1465490 RepID=A0A1I5Y2H9_9BACT|nr:SDR family oxidoreductase [Parafilimonas terrae]SFQ38405.1 NAD(P)-dependent dehydrogenase, short-chain alcohol dehydrogenase family [Parafilimonas terrae]